MQTALFLNEISYLCLNIIMNIRNLTLAVLAITSTNLFAANHMFFIGGGGEPDGATTIFDGLVETLGKNLSDSKWKYQASFNGGHSNTESLLALNFKNPVAPTTSFTEENYKKLIEDYTKKINSGEITNSDQLMIIINSHGAEKSSSTKGEATHKISAANVKKAAGSSGIKDYDNLEGSTLVSLDALAALVKLTNEKGIKLGIVDMSCHSGNTQALKNNAPNTCIITSTGPVHYGFSGPTAFNSKFISNLKPGVSLEQAFLNARASAQDYGYPMISTPEGKSVSDELYPSVTPYLYYKSEATDKLTKYIGNNSSDQLLCQRDNQFKDLIAKIDMLQAATIDKKDAYNGEELKKLLAAYKAEQDSMLSVLNQMGSSLALREEAFSSPQLTKKGSLSGSKILKMSWRNIAMSNPDDTINYFKERLAETKDLKQKADYQVSIANWNQVKAKRIEILSKYPEMGNLDKKGKELTSKIAENWKTVYAIALQERKLYNEFYKQKQTNSNDPCRQIVF